MRSLEVTEDLENAAEMLMSGPRDDIDCNRVTRALAKATVAQSLPEAPAAQAGLPAVGTPVVCCDSSHGMGRFIEDNVGRVVENCNGRGPAFFTRDKDWGPYYAKEEGTSWRRRLQSAEPQGEPDAVAALANVAEWLSKAKPLAEISPEAAKAIYSDLPSLYEPAQRPEPVKWAATGVRAAIERAVELYGGGDEHPGVFNLANLSSALREQCNFVGGVDGRICRVMLADRDDVEQFGPSDCYWRVKRQEPAAEFHSGEWTCSACHAENQLCNCCPNCGAPRRGDLPLPKPEPAAEVAVTTEHMIHLLAKSKRPLSDLAVRDAEEADIRANVARVQAEHDRAREADRRRIEELEKALKVAARQINSLERDRDNLRAQHTRNQEKSAELETDKRDLTSALESWIETVRCALGMPTTATLAECEEKLTDLRRQLGEAQAERKLVEASLELSNVRDSSVCQVALDVIAEETGASTVGGSCPDVVYEAIRLLRARAEKAEQERDGARNELAVVREDFARVSAEHQGSLKMVVNLKSASFLLSQERDDLRAKVERRTALLLDGSTMIAEKWDISRVSTWTAKVRAELATDAQQPGPAEKHHEVIMPKRGDTVLAVPEKGPGFVKSGHTGPDGEAFEVENRVGLFPRKDYGNTWKHIEPAPAAPRGEGGE